MQKKHKSKYENYRVEEYLGFFRIQVRVKKIKTKGILWWRKKLEVVEWEYSNSYGNPVSYCCHPLFIGESINYPFNRLENAFEKIDQFIEGKKYHYKIN